MDRARGKHREAPRETTKQETRAPQRTEQEELAILIGRAPNRGRARAPKLTTLLTKRDEKREESARISEAKALREISVTSCPTTGRVDAINVKRNADGNWD